MSRAVRTIATGFLMALAMASGRADDVVVDEADAAGGNGPQMMWAGVGQFDLAQMFDSQAFADRNGVMAWQVMQDERQPVAADNEAVVAERLAPVRRRLQAKIAAVDRIVGLADKQRKKLEIAAESDLRRLTDAVIEARAKYAGRTLKMDARNGVDAEINKAMEELTKDATRCREIVGQASGPESLLAKVITGTLDEPQAAKYEAVMNGRRDCRWKASVATFLGQMDETLGLTQKQHDALTAALLAAAPSAEELTGGGQGSAQVAQTLVAGRLAEAINGNAKLAAVLDPRQRAAVASGAVQADDIEVIHGAEIGGGIF